MTSWHGDDFHVTGPCMFVFLFVLSFLWWWESTCQRWISLMASDVVAFMIFQLLARTVEQMVDFETPWPSCDIILMVTISNCWCPRVMSRLHNIIDMSNNTLYSRCFVKMWWQNLPISSNKTLISKPNCRGLVIHADADITWRPLLWWDWDKYWYQNELT